MIFLERFLADFSFNSLSFVFDILIPSFLAVIFGGLIGLQRERHERPAGLRTHALVCLGATVFTLVSYVGFSQVAGVDPSRIAAGIVTGIGFIGAGAIFRQGILVKGVTTAASIWISAAIGLALGTRLYYLAIIVTLLGLLVLSFLKSLENRVIHLPAYMVKVTTSINFGEIDELKEVLGKLSSDIKTRKFEVIPEEGIKTFSFFLHSRDADLADRLIKDLGSKKDVLKISID